MKNLLINLKTFEFVNREIKSSGKIVKYRCGRDFLYYVLSYYYPNKFNTLINNPPLINDKKIKEIENNVDAGYTSAIDISLGLSGLADHILFVYGYDFDNLYVFDTHQVPGLEYEKITEDHRYIMKLPKSTIRKRWSCFGRVWVVKNI